MDNRVLQRHVIKPFRPLGMKKNSKKKYKPFTGKISPCHETGSKLDPSLLGDVSLATTSLLRF